MQRRPDEECHFRPSFLELQLQFFDHLAVVVSRRPAEGCHFHLCFLYCLTGHCMRVNRRRASPEFETFLRTLYIFQSFDCLRGHQATSQCIRLISLGVSLVLLIFVMKQRKLDQHQVCTRALLSILHHDELSHSLGYRVQGLMFSTKESRLGLQYLLLHCFQCYKSVFFCYL